METLIMILYLSLLGWLVFLTVRSFISNKPYESSKGAERGSSLGGGRRSRPGLVLAAFIWASLILFGLPLAYVRRDYPPSDSTKLLTTLVTALAHV